MGAISSATQGVLFTVVGLLGVFGGGWFDFCFLEGVEIVSIVAFQER